MTAQHLVGQSCLSWTRARPVLPRPAAQGQPGAHCTRALFPVCFPWAAEGAQGACPCGAVRAPGEASQRPGGLAFPTLGLLRVPGEPVCLNLWTQGGGSRDVESDRNQDRFSLQTVREPLCAPGPQCLQLHSARQVAKRAQPPPGSSEARSQSTML